MVVERADVFRNRHFIVVQNDQHVGPDIACVIHCFKRHTGGDGAVANHTDGAAIFAFFLRRHGNADTGADGGGGMPNAQHIVFAFSAPRERVQTAFLANGADFVATTGKDFMWISPVSNIPD